MKLIITSPCVGNDGVILEASSKEVEVPNQTAYALIATGHAKCAASPAGKAAKAENASAEADKVDAAKALKK